MTLTNTIRCSKIISPSVTNNDTNGTDVLICGSNKKPNMNTK